MLEAAAVAFLLGVISTGFGAVLQQNIVGRAVERRLREALIAELRENISRRPLGKGGAGRAGTVRTAWDAARGLRWSEDVFAALAEAYKAGEVADRFSSTAKAILEDFSDAALMRERERLDRYMDAVKGDMKAHHYFQRALTAALTNRVPPSPDPVLWTESRPQGG